MPTVPTRTGAKVQVRPLRIPRQPAQVVPVQPLVAGLNQAGSALERAQQQVEMIELQEADVALEKAWNDVLYTGDDPYFNRSGKRAFETQQATISQLEEVASTINTEHLSSGRQRRVFENSVSKRLGDHKIKVGRHAFDERQKWDVNTAVAGIDQWNESAALDPSRLAEAEVRIEELVGVIQEKAFGVPADSELGQKAVFDAKSGLYLRTLIGELERGNIASAAKMLEDRTESMTQDDRLKARRAISAEKSKRETIDKVARNRLSVAIDGLGASYDLGIVPDDADQVRAAALASGDDQLIIELENAERFKEQKVAFAGLSPTDKDEALRQTQLGVGKNSQAALLLEDFERIDNLHDQMINADPFLYYINQVEGGELPQLNSPAPVANAGYLNRAQLAKQAREYLPPGTDVVPFTQSEMDGIIAKYDSDTVTAKTQTLATIMQTMPAEAPGVFAELDKKGANVMAGVGGMFLEGRPDVAKRIEFGRDALKNEPDLLPRKVDYEGEMNDLLGDAYGRGTELRATIEKMILSNYAGYAAAPGSGIIGGTDGALDPEAFERSIEDVTGGLIEHRGYIMPVPRRGKTQDDFDDWFHLALSPSDFQGIDGYTPELAFEVTRGRANAARLILRRPGQYAVAWQSSDPQLGTEGEVSFKRADGSEFLLNYRDASDEEIVAGGFSAEEQFAIQDLALP